MSKEISEHHFYVYVHTNKINGKKYVGVTAQENPEHRWGSNGGNYRGNPRFWPAIQKYGWDNFSHECWEVESEEKMYAEEIRLISEMHTKDSANGYNCTDGGEGTSGYKWTEEQCAHASEFMLERWQDLDFQARQSELQKAVWDDPLYRARMSDVLSASWDNVDRHNHMSAVITEKWSNVEYRTKVIASITGKERSPDHCKALGKAVSKSRQNKHRAIGPDGKIHMYTSEEIEEQCLQPAPSYTSKGKTCKGNLGKHPSKESNEKRSRSLKGYTWYLGEDGKRHYSRKN